MEPGKSKRSAGQTAEEVDSCQASIVMDRATTKSTHIGGIRSAGQPQSRGPKMPKNG